MRASIILGFVTGCGGSSAPPAQAPAAKPVQLEAAPVATAAPAAPPATEARRADASPPADPTQEGQGASTSRMIVGPTQVTNGSDGAIVHRQLVRSSMKLQYCFEKQVVVTKQWELRGTVFATFTIGPDGAVTASSATHFPVVDACVAEAIQGIAFPRPDRGLSVQVAVPLTFELGGS